MLAAAARRLAGRTATTAAPRVAAALAPAVTRASLRPAAAAAARASGWAPQATRTLATSAALRKPGTSFIHMMGCGLADHC